jgi:hypothetical protein
MKPWFTTAPQFLLAHIVYRLKLSEFLKSLPKSVRLWFATGLYHLAENRKDEAREISAIVVSLVAVEEYRNER